jgi:hypothetical protein
VGLFVSARLFHQAKMGPLESRRNLAFTDSAEWNQFYDAGSVRRFVGLARQGEVREITDAPPEHRPEEVAPAPVANALAPVELPKQGDGAEAATVLAARPAAETTANDNAPPMEKTTTVAAPSMPEQARETPVTERAAVLSVDTVVDIKPAPAETVVSHVAPTPVPGESPAAEEPTPAEVMHLPESSTRDGAGAVVIETENGWDQEPWDITSVIASDMNEPAAVTGRVETAPATAAEIEQQQPKPPPPAAPHPSAALAKAAAPVPTARTPVKRAVPDDDDEPERPRAGSPPRPRALASRPRAASQAYAPQWNGTQWVDPRQPPPGQPVFGPHFPYATPQPGQPQFGTQPQVSRQPVARARAPQYAQPSYDPRQFAPQPFAPRAAPRQPSYSPAYGWR